MKIAYLQCIGGVSGDMLLGALVAAGVPADLLRDRLAALALDGFELEFEQVSRRGIAATRALVRVEDDVTERRLPEILALIERSGLPRPLQGRARRVFERLGEKEAAIHGQTVDRVHLHELGGIDTIVDVVGVLAGFEALAVEQIVCSPLPVGAGLVRAAHGLLPLPAPATLALLEGVPIHGAAASGEMVTPTGAALVTELAVRFGPLPAMTVGRIGYGAGARDGEIPNVVRLLVGDAAGDEAREGREREVEQLVMLETDIDDMNPELYEHVADRLFAVGALDVNLHPTAMKKHRAGILLRVLCRPGGAAAAARDVLFRETTTLGVREHLVTRTALPREIRRVETAFGPVRVKVAWVDAATVRFTPEYGDCRERAIASGQPLQTVYRAALRAAEEQTAGETEDEATSPD